MRIGDIYYSVKAPPRAPNKVFIVTDIDGGHAVTKYEKDGALKFGGRIPIKLLAFDTAHYRKLSYIDIQTTIIEKLRSERRKAHDR